MKILAVGSHCIPDTTKQSQVDHWRIGRPMLELAKHVDWQIDHSPSFIPGFAKYERLEEFTAEEMEKAFQKICTYDIVFSSYHPDPTAYTMLKVAKDRAGVEFVMDCDDDMFAINPDNPFWLKMTHEKVYWMQRMIADNGWITTPSPILAARFRGRRPDHPPESVNILPNFISDDYKYTPFDHGDELVIGYMGGSSHYADLHESGALEALEKLMHEKKNIRFKSVGMVVDKYIPRGRLQFDGGQRGTKFLTEVFPSMQFDIGLAPLLDNIFNEGKSNIKWQEYTRAGAVSIVSDREPYGVLNDGVNTIKVKENTPEAWYVALKRVVDSAKMRKIILDNAKKDLMQWRLEKNWVYYKQLFERVKGITSVERPPTPLILQA